MIIQVTLTRDEGFLINELLPVWKKYADGFVFLVDSETSDNTREILKERQGEYNILEVIEMDKYKLNPNELETTLRQTLFDTASKYSSKIICLDTDEYLDGSATKEQLEAILDNNPDTLFYLQWIQYTSKTKRRVDMFWKDVFHDRIGSYNTNSKPKYGEGFSHTSHLPGATNARRIDPNQLFVAHLQWLDKRWVGIKQYYWKVWDYVNNHNHGVHTISSTDYDASVNNFAWEYEYFEPCLKIREDIYKVQNVKDNYKLNYIVEATRKYNIPNLGDWNMGIYEYAKPNKKDISVLIVTFKERFEYVRDLISKVRSSSGGNVDILLAINGNNEELFDESYREQILQVCKDTPRCYPIMCPEFKSLPKLWNTLVLFSRTDYNFILCDDVEYGNPDTLNLIEKYIQTSNEEFFTINGGFSFFVITKQMLHKLNYFDERLCGYGEEDGDIIHSFILKENRPLPVLHIDNIYNKALYDIKNKNIEAHVDNKPKFNREFSTIKYKEDSNGICGMNPTPISRQIEDKQQYPYEMFVQYNKHNIKKFNKVIMKYE